MSWKNDPSDNLEIGTLMYHKKKSQKIQNNYKTPKINLFKVAKT